MKTFLRFVAEEWHTAMPSPYKAHQGESIHIYKNPSSHEVAKIVHGSEAKTARGILHGKDAYVWDGMGAIHADVDHHLKLGSRHKDHFNIGKDRIFSEYLPDTPVHVTEHPWVKKTLPNHKFFHA